MSGPLRIEHSHGAHADVAWVDWNLGNQCNFSCSYCPVHLHDGSLSYPEHEVMVDFSERLISHYSLLGKSVFIQFSGGEPTFYPEFLRLAACLKSQGCFVGVLTNGSRSTSWWEKARESLDSVGLTFHPEHSHLPHLMRVLDKLTPFVRVHVNVAMLPERFDECLEAANSLATNGRDFTLTLKPLLVEYGEELYPYSDQQLEVLRKLSPRIVTTRSLWAVRGPMREIFSDGSTRERNASRFVAERDNNWRGWFCNVGIERLTITAGGAVYRGVCRVGGRIGLITDPVLEFPRVPVVCSREDCHCLSDIMTTRWRHDRAGIQGK